MLAEGQSRVGVFPEGGDAGASCDRGLIIMMLIMILLIIVMMVVIVRLLIIRIIITIVIIMIRRRRTRSMGKIKRCLAKMLT